MAYPRALNIRVELMGGVYVVQLIINVNCRVDPSTYHSTCTDMYFGEKGSDVL